MLKFFVLLAAFSLFGGLPAQAFWQRSQLQACREVPTEIERQRLQCWIFEPVLEWPLPAAGYYDSRLRRLPPARWRK